jgi:TonB-dependent SusC/RagA subfamily outer membrane receptor
MKIIIVVFLLMIIGIQGCATTDTVSEGIVLDTDTDDIISYENFRDLADYLRRIPGVQVTGAGDNVNVQIRGTSSFTSETRPLYVVDGQIRGNSYYEVNRYITMSEVANIRVLKDNDAASYGARGANGVIIIDLKR